MDYINNNKKWNNNSIIDDITKKELLLIQNNYDEIKERFYNNLELEGNCPNSRGKRSGGSGPVMA